VVSREVSEEAFMAGATFILAGNSYADAQSEKARYVTRRAQEKP
jgi:cob(I)alamin adenosyltransferase